MMKTIEKQVRETDSWAFSLFDINPLKKHFSIDSLKHVGRFWSSHTVLMHTGSGEGVSQTLKRARVEVNAKINQGERFCPKVSLPL